jgi:hypothetical protein
MKKGLKKFKTRSKDIFKKSFIDSIGGISMISSVLGRSKIFCFPHSTKTTPKNLILPYCKRKITSPIVANRTIIHREPFASKFSLVFQKTHAKDMTMYEYAINLQDKKDKIEKKPRGTKNQLQ